MALKMFNSVFLKIDPCHDIVHTLYVMYVLRFNHFLRPTNAFSILQRCKGLLIT